MRKILNIKYQKSKIYFRFTQFAGLLVCLFIGLFHFSYPVLAASKPKSLGGDEGLINPLPSTYEPTAGDEGAASAITKIFSNALAIFTLAAGIMFLIYFVLAALAWITSSGKPEKVQEAQNRMINAVIGLIAVVATYTIAYVVGKVLGFDLLNPADYIQKFWGMGSTLSSLG